MENKLHETNEWEEHAKKALEEISLFLDVEKEFIIAEHSLIDVLQSLEYVIAHLDELTEEEILFELRKIVHITSIIERKIEKFKLRGLRLVKEQKDISEQLKISFGHKIGVLFIT